MKVILCLCLVAPLVFGSAIPAESEVDIQASNILNDYLGAPTEEQMKCVEVAVQKVKDANPDLEWWFDDLKKLADNVQSEYEKCKSIDKEPEQKKCLHKLKLTAKIRLLKVVKTLPKDKKEVLAQLKDGIKKCFEEV